jgi:hypothetical protein
VASRAVMTNISHLPPCDLNNRWAMTDVDLIQAATEAGLNLFTVRCWASIAKASALISQL